LTPAIKPQEANMAHHFHAVVWIDHRAAQIFEFGADDVEHHRIAHHGAAHHIHNKAGSVGSGHAHEDQAYLKAVGEALHAAGEILVTGAGQAKAELMNYLKTHAPQVAARVLGVETLDRPSDGEIVAFARKYFAGKDRTTPQIPAT
jgi:stalled ribosome rescue protein Dom34